MPTLTFREDAGKHRFEALCDGELAGFLEYKFRDGAIDLKHTETLAAFGGKGVGSFLAGSALDHVRASGEKVIPSCDFVAGYIRKHPEYQDLLATSP